MKPCITTSTKTLLRLAITRLQKGQRRPLRSGRRCSGHKGLESSRILGAPSAKDMGGGAMSRRTTTLRKATRVHPLLQHACRCLTNGRWGCVACTRWSGHCLALLQRNVSHTNGGL